MKTTLRTLPFAAALLLTACTAAAETTLHDLGSVDELRQAFQEDAGKPRVILLLSPT